MLEVLKATVIIQGIGTSYDNIREHLLLDDSLTYEQLTKRLIEKAERFKFENQSGITGDHVNAAAVTADQGAGKKQCEHCGINSHTAAECFTKNPHLRPPNWKPRGERRPDGGKGDRGERGGRNGRGGCGVTLAKAVETTNA